METEPFELRFLLSEALFCRAHRAHLRRRLFRAKNLFLVTIALLMGAVQTQLFGGADWALEVFALLWVAVIGLVIAVYIWMPRRIYRRSPQYSGEQLIRVNDVGVERTGSGSQPERLTWDELTRSLEIHTDFLVVRSEHRIPWVIPRSAFANEEQIRAFLD